jgi:hypothetical protein
MCHRTVYLDGRDDSLKECCKNIPNKTNYLHLQAAGVYTQTGVVSIRLHQHTQQSHDCLGDRERHAQLVAEGGKIVLAFDFFICFILRIQLNPLAISNLLAHHLLDRSAPTPKM